MCPCAANGVVFMLGVLRLRIAVLFPCCIAIDEKSCRIFDTASLFLLAKPLLMTHEPALKAGCGPGFPVPTKSQGCR